MASALGLQGAPLGVGRGTPRGGILAHPVDNSLPIGLMDRVPGRGSARGRCGGCQWRGPKSWEEEAWGSLGAGGLGLEPFLSVFQSSVPHGMLWGREEEATCDFTHGGWGRTSVGPWTVLSFRGQSGAFRLKGLGLGLGHDPSSKEAIISATCHPSQCLVNRKPDQFRD